MKSKIYLAFCSAMLLAGCMDSPTETLDAEAGKDKLNAYDFNQGALFSTGEIMDLAIRGKGLFVLKNGDRPVYFRRPANFFQDADGYLTLGNTKTRLQGIKLFRDGDPYTLAPPDSFRREDVKLSELSDIHWGFKEYAPPRATTEIQLARNLDSDSHANGTIVYSQKFLTHAQGGDGIRGLMDRSGNELGIQTGDVLTFSAIGAGAEAEVVTDKFRVVEAATLADLTAAMTTFLRSPAVGAGGNTSVSLIAPGSGDSLRGALIVSGNSTAIHVFSITCNRPISSQRLSQAFSLPALIPGGAATPVATEPFRSPARAESPLAALYDANGNPLGLESEDEITFFGSLGGTPTAGDSILFYAQGSTGTTLQDVLDRIRTCFHLPVHDGTFLNNRSVSINADGSDNIPDGAILIRGQPGRDLAIQNMVVRATDADNSGPSPNFFNTNMNMTTLREARDPLYAQSSITAFDDKGAEHTLTFGFLATPIPNRWLWEAKLEGPEVLVRGGHGSLSFGPDAAITEFTYADSASALEFNPGNGAQPVKLRINAGGPGDFTGLTQFRHETTVAAVAQNGFTGGTLKQISIGEDGIIAGFYTNGQSRPLYEIPVADFPNKLGLKSVGQNSFLESKESGKPIITAGIDNDALIAPGAVEYMTSAEYRSLCELHGCASAGQ